MANSSLNLSTLNGNNGFAINGITVGDRSGFSVSSAGDINSDGIDDLIIGAIFADPNGNYSGQSYVVFGSRSTFSASLNPSTLNGANGFAINGITADDFSGRSVSSAGDINGDGIDDLIIGASGAPNGSRSGQSYVVFGSRSTFSASLNLSTLNGANGFAINGILGSGSRSGISVSSAGDINGDGIDDLTIGAYRAEPNGIFSGQSYVVFGSRSTFSASLNLSTLNGNNGFAINGINVGDRSGYSVSSAGDINGDGIDDLIIGAFTADPNGNPSGQSYVVFGNRSPFSASLNLSTLNGANGFAINGITANDQLGRSVSSAGDINGDGIDDLIIGANSADPNGSDSGQSYVVFGSRSTFSASLNLSTLNGANGFAINGLTTGDRSGRSVSSAGDINGDGIDDLIIGAFLAAPNGTSSGQSYVVYGNAAPELDLNGSNNLVSGFKINGIARFDFSGRSVSSAGDINGDGIDDLIIGADRADPNGNLSSGQSYVVFGSRSGFSANINLSTLTGTNGFKINGIAAGDYSGYSVSSVGDINGDGIDDLIIGAFGADPNGNYSGQSYIVFGSRSGFTPDLNLSTLNGTNGFRINGIAGGDRSGYSVSSAGDINGDGIDDLIIGANRANPNGINNSGQSYIVFGSRSGFSSSLELSTLTGTNGFKINGIAANDYSGRSVSSAGDINGDGIDDLIIGADRADPNGNLSSGQSYVVFGSRSGFSSNLNLSSITGTNGFKINGIAANDFSGRSVSSAGDINGDGIDDLIIGADRADPNGNLSSGQSYVVFGSRSGFSANLNLSTLDGTNGFKINGIAESNYSGRSVSSAGDINGDGIDDLIIGADRANPNGISSGQSYVVFGSQSGFSANLNLSTLNGTNGFKINGIAAGDRSGYSVSSAGDINGDGIDDLIIGANRAVPNGSSSGQSYVVFGRAGIGASGTLELSQLSGSTTDGIDFSTTFIGTAIAIVDTDLTLVDRNSANLVGATITITNLFDGAAETLSATATGTGITATYTNGVLTLSGTGTVAQYQQVLRSVTYNNTAPAPNITDRNITFVVDDGASNSNTSVLATTTLAFKAVRNDFNNDHKSDVLWRNNDGSVLLWQMNGNTVLSSSPTSIATAPNSWKIAGTGDFGGDNKSDILWRNDDGSVAVWQMDGNTVLSSGLTSITGVPNSWKIAGTGDFGGDNKSDILWRNDNGSVAIWQIDGNTVLSSGFTSISSVLNSWSWKIAGTGDFGGDGKSDILWRNDDGSVAIWQMDGNTVLSSGFTSISSTDNGWKIAGTGDFGGDGKSDILWRHDDGLVAVWQMDGNTVLSSGLTSVPIADVSWNISGTGDFNGDGKSDILWRNDNGLIAQWQMDGLNVLSTGLTSTAFLGNDWQIAAPIL
jgi:FG-GAP repeat/FG-GAP-like repeat